MEFQPKHRKLSLISLDQSLELMSHNLKIDRLVYKSVFYQAKSSALEFRLLKASFALTATTNLVLSYDI